MTSRQKFIYFSQFLIFYTLLVILWGAWVRISHSGDGCGDSWPLCQGQVIPQAEHSKTWVELSHRLMSGLFGFFILGLFFWARKLSEKKSELRLWATLSLIFMITEALLGAGLVRLKLVVLNDSPLRAFIMPLHLVNSLLLVSAITLTWELGKNSFTKRSEPLLLLKNLSLKKITAGFLFAFLILSITGAWASLSSTLFPSQSLLEGLQKDLATDSHYLIQLRGFHPLAGVFLGGSLALTAWLFYQALSPLEQKLKRRSLFLTLIVSINIFFGISTLILLYPVWMKITHLTLGYGVWIALVLWLRELSSRSNPIA